MSEFLEFTVIGVAVGAAYAILASGLVVTYTTSGIFNFAHGAVAMLAAFSYWELQQHHVPTAVGMVIVVVVGAPLAGAVVERLFMRHLHGASTERPIMVTLGLLVVMLGVATLIWDIATSRTVSPLVDGTFRIFGVSLQWQNAVLLAAALAVAVVLRLLLYRTRLGTGMRAVVDDPELLTLSGVSPARMSRAGWMLGFFLAALAGVLVAPTLTSTFTVLTMTLLVVDGYAAAVVGRLKSIPWTFAGAIVLGLVVTYFQQYAPSHLPTGVGSDITAALPMIFLFAALVALPSVRLRAVGRLATLRVPRVAGGWESVVSGAGLVVAVVVFAVVMGGGTFLAPGSSTAGPIVGQTMAYGVVALSLVLLVGYAGQVSLCQLAFMGIGAFCMGKVAGGGSLLGVLVAVAVCAALGALIALPATRLRGLYLALATFAFAEGVQSGFFGDLRVLGTAGIPGVRLSIGGLTLRSDRSEVILLAVVFVLAALMVLAIRRSRYGRRLVALNDSPAACATVGLNPSVTKVAVFALAAGLAGLGGALWATLQLTVTGNAFTIFSGVTFLLFLVIWGARTVSGAFLASLTYAIAANVPNVNRVEGVVVGALGVLLVGRAANGILGIGWLQDRIRLPWAARGGAASGALPGGTGGAGGTVEAAYAGA
ncbi:MAG: ABC transporter permease, partial [Acidimicrobiales bacterium]